MDVGEIIYKKSEFIETVSKLSFVDYLFLKSGSKMLFLFRV